jgi:hypothetical protein
MFTCAGEMNQDLDGFQIEELEEGLIMKAL